VTVPIIPQIPPRAVTISRGPKILTTKQEDKKQRGKHTYDSQPASQPASQPGGQTEERKEDRPDFFCDVDVHGGRREGHRVVDEDAVLLVKNSA
jgi:hypothetical protein